MENHSELPAPAGDARAHGRSIVALIRERIIAAGGWIDFSEYMDLALYAPGIGYYSAGSRKFGAGGDFVTAPEISRLFGRCIARSVAGALSGFSPGVVLEVGAGTGAMAVEILHVLEREAALPERYLILEVSADLRERQQATIRTRIPGLAARVEWLDTLPEKKFDGVILANEVLDALPVTRFTVGEQGLLADGVVVAGDAFSWSPRPAPDALREMVRRIEASLSDGLSAPYTSEVCPSLPAFVTGLAGTLNRGLILFVDYGLPRREYYHPDRSSGTLQCHYRHRAHADPFFYPGLQDITAWVDFTAVGEAAAVAGLEVRGYTTQAHFLLAAGIDGEFETLRNEADAAGKMRPYLELTRQIKTLMMPGEMGERFKVMGLGRGLDVMPVGFSGRDLRHLL